MVVIGHSMGGCIGRLLITDTGDSLWKHFFGKPPEQTKMSPESKELSRITPSSRTAARVGTRITPSR
ncbi:MAG: hypothetical protein ACAI34_16490 [Verrucomicrobium sp.]